MPVEHSDPMVIKFGELHMQVCVPADWDNTQVRDFAERKYPSGTKEGWFVRHDGPHGPERCPCTEREGFVHIVLED